MQQRISVDEFREWLEAKSVKLARCPECGSDQMAIHADETGNCVSQVATGLSGDRLRSFSDCRIFCANCGYIRAFSAKIIAGGGSL